MQRLNKFHWSYLITMEDSTGSEYKPEYSLTARTFKSMLWVGVSFICAMGISQLT